MIKNIKKVCFFAVIFLSVIFCNSIVNAASFSASASKTTIEKGKTATITITAKECGGRFDIKSSNSSVVAVSESSKWVENGSSSITITAKKTGTATITVTATSVASTDAKDVTGSKKISITVKDSTTNNNNNNNNNNNQTPTTPKDPEPTFTSVKETVYAKSSANVRSSYSTSSSIIGSLKVGDSITRTGIGSNGWSKISYNGQTAYVSSALITKTKPVEPEEDKEEEKEEEKEQEQEKVKLQLSSLKVENYELDPEFSKDIYEYGLNVENDIEKLEIEAISDDKDVVIEIDGNEELKVGENNITITITKEKTDERAVYTIKTIKAGVEEKQVETAVKVNQELLNDEIDKVNSNLTVKEWTIRGIIIFVTILIIIIFILRYLTTRKYENEYEEEYDNGYDYISARQKFNDLNNRVDEEQEKIEEEIDETEVKEEKNVTEDYGLEYRVRRSRKSKGKHF